ETKTTKEISTDPSPRMAGTVWIDEARVYEGRRDDASAAANLLRFGGWEGTREKTGRAWHLFTDKQAEPATPPRTGPFLRRELRRPRAGIPSVRTAHRRMVLSALLGTAAVGFFAGNERWIPALASPAIPNRRRASYRMARPERLA
ncbi:MAG: hypothetical protein ACC628_03990, partial [Pirellulaceae bacterium]